MPDIFSKAISSETKGRWLFRHLLFHRHRLLASVSLLGIAISLIVGWIFYRRAYSVVKSQFHMEAQDRLQAVEAALSNRSEDLKSLAAFYGASEEVERKEFLTFTKSTLADHPDIEFLGWAPRVSDRLRADFEKELQKDGFADALIYERGRGGKLVPAGKRGEYFPLMFAEPQEKNRRLIGFDLNADAEARSAIALVMGTKRAAVTICKLPQADGKTAWTLCFFEHARNESPAPPRSSISRQLNKGVVISAIRLRAMVDDAIRALPPVGVNMYFYEELPNGRTSLVFARASRLQKSPLPHLEHPPAAPEGIALLTRLAVADRLGIIYCVPIDNYLQGKLGFEPVLAVFVGFLITAVLVGYMYLLVGRAEQIESLVEQRTEALRRSEQRFRRLVDGAGDGVFLHDTQGWIFDVNPRACESLGYTREELLAMNILDVDVHPSIIADGEPPWNLPENHYPMTFEGLHRRKNGETFPVEVRLTCVDYGGQRRLIGLARDITERKQAEEALKAEQRLLRQLLDLMENDRKLVAYEIHDGLAQLLTGLSLQLQTMQVAGQQKGAEAALAMLPKIVDLVGQCVLEARRLIGGLRPLILDQAGVVAAIEYLVGEKRRTESAEIEFRHDVNFRHLAGPLESAIFRIAQESLTNACRYSRSKKIEIELKQADSAVQLRIQDWGTGFDPKEIRGQHFGLLGIQERARLLGGCAKIISAPDAGTTISVQLPLVERSIEEENENE